MKIDKKIPKECIRRLPKLDKDSQYKDKYKELLLDHREWKRKADHLLEVAALFQEKIKDTWANWSSGRKPEASDHFITIYFMLTSYALENLFKALIVLRKRTDLEKKLRFKLELPSEVKGHDLYRFAQTCGFDPLNAGDEELLRKLSRSATWYGRYPIPMKPHEFETIFISRDEIEPELIITSSYASSDVKEIEKWVEELNTSLNEEAKTRGANMKK
ncbi:MAG: hypothetical protein FJ117_04655 [Deltaproteobacteria bacterium]|nr:hypothetical protein [Deltaproteobacteria bacterium]